MRRMLTLTSFCLGLVAAALAAATLIPAPGLAQTRGRAYLPLTVAGFDLAQLPEPAPWNTPPQGPTATDTPQPTPSDTPLPPDSLVLLLQADRSEVPFGAMAAITATFVNGTSASVVLIKPVDASTYGWVMPQYLWEVSRADGRPVRQRVVPRCGVVNPLRRDDFFELGPGSTWAMGSGYPWLSPPEWHWSFTAPGTYEIRMRYVVDKGREPDVLPEVEDLWRAAYEGEVLSQPIWLTVGGPTGRYATRLAAYGAIQVGWHRAAVEALMGTPDQEEHPLRTSETQLVYYLADPAPGDPPTIPYPRDESHRRPRIVVTLDADALVSEVVLLP